MGAGGGVRTPIPTECFAFAAAREQAVIGRARIGDNQIAGVGVANKVIGIDLAGAQQLVHQRQNKQPVAARRNADPFVGNRRITGADGIDQNELGAAFLQFPDARLYRVAVMVLGNAEHQKIAGEIPIWFAEFPECAAHGVDAGGGHIDRAEAAMRRVIGRSEFPRPPAGQRLAGRAR